MLKRIKIWFQIPIIEWGISLTKPAGLWKNLKGKKYRVTGVVEGSVEAQDFKEGDKLSSIEVNGERHIKLQP